MQDFLLQFCFVFVLGLCSAIIALVYVHILAYENVLNWWFRFGCKFEKKWFHKPIWGCEKCIAGQIALWWYLKMHTEVVFSPFKACFDFIGYNLPFHILSVCIAVLVARIGVKIFEKYNF